jgi:hypothetical protein
MVVLPVEPSLVQQHSNAFKALSLMILWCLDKGLPSEHTQWFAGSILALPTKASRRRGAKNYHRVQFHGDGSILNCVLPKNPYSTDPSSSVEFTYFAFGTVADVAAVQAIV